MRSSIKDAQAMILAVADDERALMRADPVRPGHAALPRIAVRTVAALACAEDRVDHAGLEIDTANAVVLGVGNDEAPIGRVGDALRPVERRREG